MEWLSIKKEATEKDIAFIENKLNITLPKDYKSMICKINGAALKNAYVDVEGVGNVPYTRNISINKDAKVSVLDLMDCVNNAAVRYFPFSTVGNGDYFCFDLKDNSVVLYLHELQKYKKICNNFTEMLSKIKFD